jgi:hypothetical protein
MAPVTTALVMRVDATRCRETASALRRLGLAVTEFGDGCRLYAHALALGTSRDHDRRSVVILAEPTLDVVRDLETLRSGSSPTPLVLVGDGATPEVARRLRAAYLACAQPTSQDLRKAIDLALQASPS